MKKIISALEVIKFNLLLNLGMLVPMGKSMEFEEAKQDAKQDWLEALDFAEAMGDFEEAEEIRRILATF